jgi:branched-chain amino acid aminotransferase
MTNIYYTDGKFVADFEATFPINDLGILRGYACFEFMRTYNHRLVFLKDHIARLQHSARQLGIELPWSTDEIVEQVEETLRRNPKVESCVRILVTGGPSSDFITPDGQPRLAILVAPLPVYPSAWYRDGAHIITIHYQRPLPDAKSTDYLRAVVALAEARRRGAIEAVYLDNDGYLREGTTSNIFAIFDGLLVTPTVGILKGITRQKVIDLIEDKIDFELREIHRSELVSATEVFITSSNRLIVPIIRVDNDGIGNGRPGTMTRKVMRAFTEFTDQLSGNEP